MDVFAAFIAPALAGVFVGVMSGLLGVGGGTIMVPIFRLAFGMSPLASTATSLFAIIPTSISGVVAHARAKTCVPKLGLALGVGGAVMSPMGVWLASVSPGWLVICVAAIVIGFSALKMFKKKSGVIVNISSVSSVLAIPGQSVYSATKGAVNALTATLAKELAPYGIRVNAVAPGFVETEMLDHIPQEQREGYLKSVPMGRFAKPEEVGDAVCTLCDPTLSYLTGQTLILDGGLSL